MIDSLTKVRPRVAKKHIIRAITSGLVPFIKSSPGVGKSSIVHEIGNEYNLELRDHRLSTSVPEDMSGLPRFDDKGEAYFAPFGDIFPLEHHEIPEGKSGWLLFLDEFNSAPKAVQAACYKLILDRRVGQYEIHPKCVIVLAGNLNTDRAITNPLSTAMQSRVIHIEMEVNHEDWLMDVALKNNWDSRIISYLSQYPTKLMDFDPSHNENTFCCPRTWEFVNKLLKTEPKDEISMDDVGLYAGTITSGVATEFITFTAIYSEMVDIQDIINDPENTLVPQKQSARWITITKMMEHVDEETFGPISIYANKFGLDFRILFYRMALTQKMTMVRNHPNFAKAMVELDRYLNG